MWAGIHGIYTLKIRRRMDISDALSAEKMVQMLINNFLRGFNMNNDAEQIIPMKYRAANSGIDA